jgi:hypothetical protein
MNIANTKHVASLRSADTSDIYANSYPEDGAAVITVHTNGMISDCNYSAGELLKCAASSFTWRHISTFFPQLTEVALLIGENINPNLSFLSRIGYHFEAVAMKGMHFANKLFFVDIDHLGEHYLRLIIKPISKKYSAG